MATYHSKNAKKPYFPPLLANGDIAVSVDAEGGSFFGSNDYFPEAKVKAVQNGGVFRAGRRTRIKMPGNRTRLLRFGRFSLSTEKATGCFEQTLIAKEAAVKSEIFYQDGTRSDMEAFVFHDRNIYALRRRFTEDTLLTLTYMFDGYDEESENALSASSINAVEGGFRVDFNIDGNDRIVGAAVMLFDGDIKVDGKKVTVARQVKAGEDVFLWYFVEDGLFDDFEARLLESQDAIAIGYDALFAKHKTAMTAYFAEGYVKTGEKEIDECYETALYHLKATTTRWSCAIGINDSSWDARYFAFDEYYGYYALLSAGRTSLARRVPEFRLAGLPLARFRQCPSEKSVAAHYPWETGEHGEELAPPGHWEDHIFHMALVAIGPYEYYEYTKDIEALRRYYPIILACARYYTTHSIYQDSAGAKYVGKCTDLERLGSSVEKAFMTTCGVIKCLEVFASAASVLGVDAEYREECLETAKKLRESLPVSEGRFVPYPCCKERSVGVFSGKFPYDVIDKKDTRLLNAWSDFLLHEDEYGNMYAEGHAVNAWYASWKTEGFARVGDGKSAYVSLLQAARASGAFSEFFEVNERELVRRPWFMTAAAVYTSSLNDMLVSSDGETVTLLPAFPKEKAQDLSFKVAAKGGVTVEAKFENGAPTVVSLAGGGKDRVRVVFEGKEVTVKR